MIQSVISPRQRITALFARKPADRHGLWLGDPHELVLPKILTHAGLHDMEAVRQAWGDDCRWIAPPEWACWSPPDGRPAFDSRYGMGPRKGHAEPGCFAEVETIAEIDRHPWPDARWIDMDKYRLLAQASGDCARFGGVWGPFFHMAMDYFGFENYFMAMASRPDLVHAVHRHITDFFLAANARVLAECADEIDVFFFGNDFGTQRGLFMSQTQFRTLVLPYFREMIDQVKAAGKPVLLHSCGSIAEAIGDLIDAGIDGLHPLQARATGMAATDLRRRFGDSLVWVGGVDAQDLLWRGTAQQVTDEVHRLRDAFGPRWIVSPSHEKVMPEVPPANLEALARAAVD